MKSEHELKDLAKQIISYERIIRDSQDKAEINKAKLQIMAITNQLEPYDVLCLDEMIGEMKI